MTPAERTAKIAKLRAEADRLEAEAKRNWPEKVEAGMVFRHARQGAFIMSADTRLINLVDGRDWLSNKGFDGDEADFTYLGHARDLLTIKTPDAPEPTGAELVGKVCDFSDNGMDWTLGNLWTSKRGGDPRICTGFSPDSELKYHNASCAWKYARLYREDRP